MQIQSDYDLQHLNSMAVPCRAAGFASIHNHDDLLQLLAALHTDWREKPRLIIGAGSNILLVDDYPGLVIHPAWDTIDIIEDNGDELVCTVGAGRNWHQLVCWSVSQNLHGLENLALIPGLVGAAPMQNIGAYGAEFASVCLHVEICDLDTGKHFELDREACRFGYRDSVFKTGRASNWLITAVTIRLARSAEPVLDYPGLRDHLQRRAKPPYSAAAIAAAVSEIRQRKLPDPARLGNCGSFFKNPLVDQPRVDALLADYPDMPYWPHTVAGCRQCKLSAAWLIERCGWKGQRRGNVGVAARHALVLVNYGGGTGRNIWQLATAIRANVAQRFAVTLEPEPMIIINEPWY